MKNKRTLMTALLALCCALLVPFAAMAQENDYEPLPLDYYQTPIINDDPSRAYVEMIPYTNPVYQIFFEDVQSQGWQYNYYFEEVNGVPFTLTALHEILYNADGQVIRAQVTEDLYFFETLRLTDGVWQEFGMRFEQPADARWVAYQMDGVDDAGNQQSFHCLFELLAEEKPAQSPADFQLEQQMEAGKPFMALYSDPEVVYASKDGNQESAEYWWAYNMVFENTGEGAFTAHTLNEVGFNGEAVVFDSVYSAQNVISWCDEEDCVIEPGERWVIECAMPVQELAAVGMRLTGTDSNGNEMSFVGMFELRPEMKPE